MPVIYEIKCKYCGDVLEISSIELDRDNDLTVTVEPCESCLDKARDEGKED